MSKFAFSPQERVKHYTTNQLEGHIREGKDVGSVKVEHFKQELNRRKTSGTLHPEKDWGVAKQYPSGKPWGED